MVEVIKVQTKSVTCVYIMKQLTSVKLLFFVCCRYLGLACWHTYGGL